MSCLSAVGPPTFQYPRQIHAQGWNTTQLFLVDALGFWFYCKKNKNKKIPIFVNKTMLLISLSPYVFQPGIMIKGGKKYPTFPSRCIGLFGFSAENIILRIKPWFYSSCRHAYAPYVLFHLNLFAIKLNNNRIQLDLT